MIETHAFAKCILTGEHAVIRGHDAIVVPLQSFPLKLTYHQTPQEKQTAEDDLIYLLFDHVFTNALEKLNIHPQEIQGSFSLENHITIGTGLGFSAALCVAVTRWLITMGYLTQDKLFSFARELENVFHGQSSGVDIVGAMADNPQLFAQPGDYQAIKCNYQPLLLLTYSGEKSVTKKMVHKVNDFIHEQPKQAEKVDKQMQQSASLAKMALEQTDVGQGTKILAQALQLGCKCFQAWHLISASLANHLKSLFQAGAIAAKPTGCGGGGYVLSLWSDEKLFQQ
ncbi:MAG: hypothetical protein AAGG80_07645, partial [Pseudomonadota bacterium]